MPHSSTFFEKCGIVCNMILFFVIVPLNFLAYSESIIYKLWLFAVA